MKTTPRSKLATIALVGTLALPLAGCGAPANAPEAEAAPTAEAQEADKGTAPEAAGAILMDCSGKVYDARTESDKLPSDMTGTLEDGWTMMAEVENRGDGEAVVIDLKNPENQILYSKIFEGVGMDADVELPVFWAVAAGNYPDYPTFVVSLKSGDSAKTWVMSYVAEESAVHFWTPGGGSLGMPGTEWCDYEPIEGQATDFDGTTLTVGDKAYVLATGLVLAER